MVTGITRDEFYLRWYIAPILPIAMFSAGATSLVLTLSKRFMGRSIEARYEFTLFGCEIAMILLAWLCRRQALAGKLTPASLTVVAFGGVAALLGVTRAVAYKSGLLTFVPSDMILVLIGSLFALRLWHLLLGYVATMAPAVWYARTVSPEITTEGKHIGTVLLFSLLTALTFYLLGERFRRFLFGVLEENDARAKSDPLTGLLNRTAWYERVGPMLRGADAARTDIAVLFMDIDHFKQINDRFGHARGDEALLRIAGLLRDVMPADALIARFGGEEFVVLLTGCTLEQARSDTTRLQAQLRQSVFPGHAPTISIGIACRERGEDIDTLLRRADLALLRAKELGRDRAEVASATA